MWNYNLKIFKIFLNFWKYLFTNLFYFLGVLAYLLIYCYFVMTPTLNFNGLHNSQGHSRYGTIINCNSAQWYVQHLSVMLANDLNRCNNMDALFFPQMLCDFVQRCSAASDFVQRCSDACHFVQWCSNACDFLTLRPHGTSIRPHGNSVDKQLCDGLKE